MSIVTELTQEEIDKRYPFKGQAHEIRADIKNEIQYNNVMNSIKGYVVDVLMAGDFVCMNEGKVQLMRVSYQREQHSDGTIKETSLRLTPSTKADLASYYSNRKFFVPEPKVNKDGDTEYHWKRKNFVDFWYTECEERPTYAEVVFQPHGYHEKPFEEILESGMFAEKVYNRFKGFAIKPDYSKMGKGCDLILHHIYNVICGGDRITMPS